MTQIHVVYKKELTPESHKVPVKGFLRKSSALQYIDSEISSTLKNIRTAKEAEYKKQFEESMRFAEENLKYQYDIQTMEVDE